VVDKKETMGFWSQIQFMLITRALKSMNADPPSGSEV